MKEILPVFILFLFAVLIAIASTAIEIGIIWCLLKLIAIGFGIDLLSKFWIITGIILILQVLVGHGFSVKVGK